MSAPATYALKGGYRGVSEIVTTTSDLRVSYVRRHRSTGKTIGGLFTEVEDAGLDKKSLDISASGVVTDRGDTSSVETVRCRVADVPEHVRRLRTEDVEKLAALDVEINDLREKLRDLKKHRKTVAKRAFTKGTRVLGSDLVPKAEEALS